MPDRADVSLHVLAQVQHQLVDSYEAKQHSLAQVLHSGPLQELHGLDFSLVALASELAEPAAQAQLNQLRTVLRKAMQTLRRFSHELYPPTLQPFGLGATLRSALDKLQTDQPTMTIQAELAADDQRLLLPQRLALFRIYQQVVTNVERHAAAQTLKVTLRCEANAVTLGIADDGCGFILPQDWAEFAAQEKLGLLICLERAAAIQGTLTVVSTPGRGTLVQVVAPV